MLKVSTSEVISLNRHCQIQTRNFYKNWPLQKYSQCRPWIRTEVAHMLTLPKSEKWVHCLSGWRLGICMSHDHHRSGTRYPQHIRAGKKLIQVHAWEVRCSRCMHEKSVGVQLLINLKFNIRATNAWVLGSWQRSYPSWQIPDPCN
jgi:hypothetical protein